MNASDFPLASLIGEAVVLDFTDKCAGDCMSLGEFQAYSGQIQEGDMVFLHTFMLPLKIVGIEACPCRIIAIKDGGVPLFFVTE